MDRALPTALLIAVISVLFFLNNFVAAQTGECASAAGSRFFMRHVNVSLSAGEDAEKYPGIFYYDLPNKRTRLSYTAVDRTVEELTEWTFFLDGITVRTCREECSRFITDPAKNLFPVLLYRPLLTDPVNEDNGVLNHTCTEVEPGIIETTFMQVDQTLNPPEVELEITLQLSLTEGLKRATIHYPKADKDGTLFLEFLNATNLIPPTHGGQFPPEFWEPPADCDASNNITVCKRVVDVAFVLDGSSSIGIDEYELLIEFVQGFIDPSLNIITIEPNVSRAGIVVFEADGDIHKRLTYDHDEIERELQNLLMLNSNRTGGKTNITGALEAATAILAEGRSEAHRVVVLVTDGVHTTGGQSPENTATALKINGVTVIVVGVGDSRDIAQLQTLASDGAFFGTSQFEDIGKLINELVPTLCNGEYEKPCNGCAGICFCSNRCVDPPPPPSTAPPTDVPPTEAPCLDPEPICCPDESGMLHRLDCPTIHADIDFDEVDSENQTCQILECPLPEDIPGMLEPDGSVSDDATCRIVSGNGTCLIVIAPGLPSPGDPTTGLAIGVGSTVLALSALIFVAYRAIQAAATGGAGAAGAGAGIGAGAINSPVFAPASNVNNSPLAGA